MKFGQIINNLKISGVFREKQRIEPEYAWSPRHNLEERAFILVGVFNLDPGYAYGIERSWRDLTVARTIYHHLYNEHDLCRILFLERTNKTTDIGLNITQWDQSFDF